MGTNRGLDFEVKIIKKDLSTFRSKPNLIDYESSYRSFSWSEVESRFRGPETRRFNLAYQMIDRHVLDGNGDDIALRFIGVEGNVESWSFLELLQASSSFANLMRHHGVTAQDTVFLLLNRRPELYVAILGCLRSGIPVSPLFSAFGPEPIFNRMSQLNAKVLVTSADLYRKKIKAIRSRLTALQLVLIIENESVETKDSECQEFWLAVGSQPSDFEIVPTSRDDVALIHFTSGTTGTPKGAVHVHGAGLMHYSTGYFALDFHQSDIFWCTADPGWVTGTSYGVISPLLHGVTSVVYDGEFDPDRWYRILQDERVTVWYTAPTAIRMLMKAGLDLPRKYNVNHLRLIASVGEPLNPEAVLWGQRAFGLPIHDNWWQTETGGIIVANFLSQDIKPGSMGRPLPGVKVGIVEQNQRGAVRVIRETGVIGELAIRVGWPSMFRNYLHQSERYRKSFADGWYLTGDLAYRDSEGYFWFVGRSDDVIKSAGHLIGPFEVESVLLEHPAVAEAAVIGKPDPLVLETVKAFVALKPGITPSEELRLDLLAHTRRRLGPAVAPKEIDFLGSLPKTRSGKIMRRLLKAREFGEPEGDTSALEKEAEPESREREMTV